MHNESLPSLDVAGSNDVTSTIFVTNLHCASCINTVKSCLKSLDPEPEFVTYSIVSHSITVRHGNALHTRAITEELGRAGFDVYSTSHTSGADKTPLHHNTLPDEQDLEWHENLERAVLNWKRSWTSKKSDTMEARRRHIEACDECQEEAFENSDIEEKGKEPISSVVSVQRESGELHGQTDGQWDSSISTDDFIVTDTPMTQKLLKATISISGMTCSSCVSSITSSLQSVPWIVTVDVNLLTASASVTFYGRNHIAGIVNAIEDVGFSASVDDVEDARPPTAPLPTEERWKATFAVGGMTCSACVGNITRPLEQLSYVETVDVNLLTNSAAVVLKDKSKLSEVQSTIEDCGYIATLDNIRKVTEIPYADQIRSISVRVEGMYCGHCAGHITSSLAESFGTKVTVKKRATESHPIIDLQYTPQSPEITIRAIVAAISATDPAFKVSIYHPPTIEDRARDMQAREVRRILFRVGLCVITAIPSFVIGIVYMSLVYEHDRTRMYLMEPLWHRAGYVSRAQWALFILATPVYFFAADVFHRRTVKEVRAMWKSGSRVPMLHRLTRFGSMNMLISLGTSIAYFASIAELSISASKTSKVPDHDYYFDTVVFLTMFLLLGRYLEAYSKAKTGDAVGSLGKLRPSEAILVEDSKADLKIPADLLEVGDVVRVQHGSSPPFDGVVLEGVTKFDESSLTGESRVVDKVIGDAVYSGTINKGSSTTIRVTSISGTSMLDQIIQVVREGQTRRAPVERVADKITSHFVPIVVLIAVLTWLIWMTLGLSDVLSESYRDSHTGGWPLWSLRFAIAVFVVACPCGIGLAAPTALFVGGGLAARYGILVKGGGEAFQEASSIDCIVFDKTGTLTQGGEPAVTDHIIAEGHNEEEIFGIITKLEEQSSHPIATALVTFCSSRASAAELIDSDEIPGKGLSGTFKTSSSPTPIPALLGNETLLSDHNIPIPASTASILEAWKSQGKSVALLATSHTFAAAFAIADPIRPEALSTITSLQNRGLQVYMLSGDNQTTARAVGAQLSIPAENIIAGVLPDQKAAKIKYLQSTLSAGSRTSWLPWKSSKPRRATVAMVGDGINDAPALTHADVSIAIGSGSAIALSSASFILVSAQLGAILTLIDLSRTVFRRVWFNFGWALVYNLIAMPVAAGVLFPIRSKGEHIRLDPVWAALAMALSSLSVVCSSLALRLRVPGIGFRAEKGSGGTKGESESEK